VDQMDVQLSLTETSLAWHCTELIVVSRSIPHAKSHTINHYISNIRRYLTDSSRFRLTQSALIMTDPTLRPAPITVEAMDRTQIEQPSHSHGNVEAL